MNKSTTSLYFLGFFSSRLELTTSNLTRAILPRSVARYPALVQAALTISITFATETSVTLVGVVVAWAVVWPAAAGADFGGSEWDAFVADGCAAEADAIGDPAATGFGS